MSAVKEFFHAFANRTMAYDFHHVISLIFFNNSIEVKSDFTEGNFNFSIEVLKKL